MSDPKFYEHYLKSFKLPGNKLIAASGIPIFIPHLVYGFVYLETPPLWICQENIEKLYILNAYEITTFVESVNI